MAWIVDLETGKPAADVPMTVYDQNFTKLGEMKTNKDGIAYLNGLACSILRKCGEHRSHGFCLFGLEQRRLSPSDFENTGEILVEI